MRLHIFSIVPLRESKTPPLFASLISTTGVRHGDGVPFFDDHSESRQLASGALDSPEKHTVKARRMLRRKGNGNIIPQKFELFFPVLLQKIAAPDSDKAGKAPENAECFFLLSGAIVS